VRWIGSSKSYSSANISSETDENLLPPGDLTETAPTLDSQAPISIPINEPIPQQHAVETKNDTELNTALGPSSDVTVPSVDTHWSNKAYDDNANQSGQNPSLKSPRPTRVRKANPQIFGDKWVNGTISLTPSSRTFIGHIIPNMTHDDIFLQSLDWDAPFAPEYLGYLSIEHLHINPFTSEVEWVHPLSMAAKASSADTPTLGEIQKMNPEEVDPSYDAMEIELAALKDKNTMTEIPRKQIIKSTWAFRKKRRPNGEIHKYKARFVVRGDLQKLEDTESTYSPVVDWSTVRLLFVLTVALAHLATKTIDFNADFVQSSLPEPIYLELPPGYSSSSGDMVYKVVRSLYGDVRAAKLWNKHLRTICLTNLNSIEAWLTHACSFTIISS
jgi:Reverse transcriptase (RNA-dependent DNA polymerase)